MIHQRKLGYPSFVHPHSFSYPDRDSGRCRSSSKIVCYVCSELVVPYLLLCDCILQVCWLSRISYPQLFPCDMCDWSIPIVVNILQNSMPIDTMTQSLKVISQILPGMLARTCLLVCTYYTYIIIYQLHYII